MLQSTVSIDPPSAVSQGISEDHSVSLSFLWSKMWEFFLSSIEGERISHDLKSSDL